jgi:hypothetical protein
MDVVKLACKKPNFKQNLPGKNRYNLLFTEPVDSIMYCVFEAIRCTFSLQCIV